MQYKKAQRDRTSVSNIQICGATSSVAYIFSMTIFASWRSCSSVRRARTPRLQRQHRLTSLSTAEREMTNVEKTLERIARDALAQSGVEVNSDILDPTKSLVAEYGLTSVALITLVMAIESTFEVEIRDDDLSTDNFDSLAAISELLEANYAVTEAPV
jgi:acyl carrier protein